MMLTLSAKLQRGAFTLNAHFDLPTPGVVGLFGRSGCGKTTLINVIAGLLKAESARIVLNDQVLVDSERGIDIPPERRRIGYVFQEARLFPHLSVAANLRYAESRAAPPHFVSAAEIAALLDLGALMERRTHQLSGGERQRVAIGRALLSQPNLLLLDEPLASLDASRREEVLPYLEKLRDKLSVPMVYVSHNFDEVLRLATHLVLMEDGTTLAQGNIGDMSLHPGVRAIIGPEAVGAVVEGTVLGSDSSSSLTRVQVGRGELRVPVDKPIIGAKLRVQLLARDLIVATEAPHRLSVRNILAGTVTSVTRDEGDSDLISIDIGGTSIISRVTTMATRELNLAPGSRVWALVKAVSLRAHAFGAPQSDSRGPGTDVQNGHDVVTRR
jgi:molybdate transport system ATP-binding protein